MQGQGLQAVLAGLRLTEAEVAALEYNVKASPTDVPSRLRLLGYYFMHRWEDVSSAARRAEHVVWFIENSPELDVIGSPYFCMDQDDPNYQTVCDAWQRVLGRASVPPVVILNAARVIALSDPAESQRLLERGERAAPSWPIWAAQLGRNTFREVSVARTIEASGQEPTKTGDQLRARAREALAHFDRALARAPSPEWRFQLHPDCADAALECGQLEDAARHADATLSAAAACPDDRHLPDRVHVAHIVRGHIALAAGDVERAKRELEAAGAQGSSKAPVLRSFGPRFSLAQALLELGEVAAVLGYLDQCATFWQRERVTRWREAIERGERPRMHTGFEPAASAGI